MGDNMQVDNLKNLLKTRGPPVSGTTGVCLLNFKSLLWKIVLTLTVFLRLSHARTSKVNYFLF